VPVDHEMFERISSPQWLWYYHNHAKDQEEEFERSRDFVEYHASFIEPKAVQKIREARSGGDSGVITDTNFVESVKGIFGREVEFQGESTMAKATPKDLMKALDPK
jgi:hypothetical protein